MDALRTFIQPCLTYALRAGNPLKQSLDEYKRTIIAAMKEICCLPQRASQSYFFSHKRVGGLAMFDPRTECDIQAIVQGVRMLSSTDPNVKGMAKQELQYIVRRSTQQQPTADLISTYLSGIKDRRTDHLYYSYSSLWSRVRQACRCLKVFAYIRCHYCQGIPHPILHHYISLSVTVDSCCPNCSKRQSFQQE